MDSNRLLGMMLAGVLPVLLLHLCINTDGTFDGANGKGITSSRHAFNELIFIDHENLRYVEDEELTRFQVHEIKRNIDVAVKRGIHTYLLFAKETMEAMLTYDFAVDGIGHIGTQAFSENSEHRREAVRLRKALREVVEYASQAGIGLYFHSNQFIFPDEVLEVIKPATWGTAVCPGREETWEVYRGKINEFASIFPELAGLQITGDETQVSVLSCDCPECRMIDFAERVKLLTNATAEVAAQFNMEVQMRTWQRMGELGDPSQMEQGILGNVSFSIKNTDGDFRIAHGLDREFLQAAVPDRIICEFDAWREYTGHNYFPCYMGDVWADRFQFLRDQGIGRIAVRLMWNSNTNPIFDRPWGNYLNLYAFMQFSKNPDLDGQKVLRMFVEKHYPESAWEPAIELYNYTPDFHRTMLYIKGKVYNANHSRVQDDDAWEDLEEAREDYNFLTNRQDFDRRRGEIEHAYDHTIQLVNNLGDDVSQTWSDELKRGARVHRYVALSTTDKMEIIFLLQQKEGGVNVDNQLRTVEKRMRQRADEWSAWDPQSYEDMDGTAAFEDWTL